MGEGLHAAHQAILQQGGPVGFQPYRRPLKFPLRVCMPNTVREKKKAFEKFFFFLGETWPMLSEVKWWALFYMVCRFLKCRVAVLITYGFFQPVT